MPTVEINGADLFYELSGPAGAPVVTFSNSLGTTHSMWDAQIAALRGRYRCLRYDTRGHGQSAVRLGQTRMDDLADDLRALLDALSIEQTHLVGLSLGGMTGMAFAAETPARVDRLVVIASSAYLPPREEWEQRIELVRRDGMAALVERSVARWFRPSFRDNATAARVRDAFLKLAPEGYAACCGVIADMDLRPMLGGIAAPTLVVVGGEDPITPVAMSDELRRGIAGAEMVVIPRAAHLVAVEQPEAVNSHLVAFLERGERGGVARAAAAAGLANRKAVLGADYVGKALATAGPFDRPWQEFITRYAWGEIWGDPALPWKTRSLLTLAMMAALHREDEFRLHLRPALRNGVTIDELRAVLLQVAIYAGVPAANASFHWAKDVLEDELGPTPSIGPAGRSG